MTKKILVLGAAGFVGAPIVKQFLADGFSVRALVRNPNKASLILGDQVEYITGSFEDRASLESGLADVNAVNLSVPWRSEVQVTQDVTAILAKEGRKNVRVSYISGTTALPENRGYAMIDEKLKAEEILKQSGVTYSIFRPSWFMDALALFVRDGRATIFGKQKQAYYFVSLAEFARAVSKAHQLDEAANKTFVINGPQALLMQDALQQYCDALHPGIKAATMPIWFGNMLSAMTKSAELKDFVQMMSYFEKSPKVSTADGNEKILGSASISLSEWLKGKK